MQNAITNIVYFILLLLSYVIFGFEPIVIAILFAIWMRLE